MIELQVSIDELRNATGKITEWLKQKSEWVNKGDPLVLVETNKVSLEVAAPESGLLVEIYKAVGQEITAEEVLAIISPESKATSAIPNRLEKNTVDTQPKSAAVEKPIGGSCSTLLSPAVRRLLGTHKLDINTIAGTGRNGRITKADVELLLSDQAEAKMEDILPISHRQQLAAAAIIESYQTIPHVTAVFEADLSEVMIARDCFPGITKPSISAYIIATCAKTLEKFPSLNGYYTKDGVRPSADINIGMITSLPNHDLIIPVIREAQRKTITEIATNISVLKVKAKLNKLTPADISDASFSISNYGVNGALLAAPIIIPKPQVAVLGVGKLEWRQKFTKSTNGFTSTIFPAVYMTLTIDHRVVNGSLANMFMAELLTQLAIPKD